MSRTRRSRAGRNEPSTLNEGHPSTGGSGHETQTRAAHRTLFSCMGTSIGPSETKLPNTGTTGHPSVAHNSGGPTGDLHTQPSRGRDVEVALGEFLIAFRFCETKRRFHELRSLACVATPQDRSALSSCGRLDGCPVFFLFFASRRSVFTRSPEALPRHL